MYSNNGSGISLFSIYVIIFGSLFAFFACALYVNSERETRAELPVPVVSEVGVQLPRRRERRMPVAGLQAMEV